MTIAKLLDILFRHLEEEKGPLKVFIVRVDEIQLLLNVDGSNVNLIIHLNRYILEQYNSIYEEYLNLEDK